MKQNLERRKIAGVFRELKRLKRSQNRQMLKRRKTKLLRGKSLLVQLPKRKCKRRKTRSTTSDSTDPTDKVSILETTS